MSLSFLWWIPSLVTAGWTLSGDIWGELAGGMAVACLIVESGASSLAMNVGEKKGELVTPFSS